MDGHNIPLSLELDLPLQFLERQHSFRQDAISQYFTVGASICDYKPRGLYGCWQESFQIW